MDLPRYRPSLSPGLMTVPLLAEADRMIALRSDACATCQDCSYLTVEDKRLPPQEKTRILARNLVLPQDLRMQLVVRIDARMKALEEAAEAERKNESEAA